MGERDFELRSVQNKKNSQTSFTKFQSFSVFEAQCTPTKGFLSKCLKALGKRAGIDLMNDFLVYAGSLHRRNQKRSGRWEEMCPSEMCLRSASLAPYMDLCFD